MRATRTTWLLTLAAASCLAGCGGAAHHAQKIVPAKPERAFASDQSALSSASRQVVSARSTGTVVASDGFDPARDGFSFENYGFIAGAELDAHAMRELFGDAVCAGTPSDTCTLTPSAQQWAGQVSDAMATGHCFGFSVTALRLFRHLLSQGQFGGTTTFSLPFSPALQSEIAYGWAMQELDSVQRAAMRSTPADTITFLERALANRSGDGYTIGIYKADGTDGHAVTPIAIEDLGGGRFDIDIYDNNYPGATRAITVDTNSDTWSYQGSPNPNDQSGIYNGEGQTNPMILEPLAPGLSRQPCPFCATGAQGASRSPRANAGGTVRVSLAGNPDAHGHLLITTPDGRRLGFLHGRFVDQIRGARAFQPFLSEVWKAQPEPIYELPAGTAIKVALEGSAAGSTSGATIHVTGPGFGATIGNLRPSAGATDTVTMLADGQRLSLRAVRSTAAPIPTIQLAGDAGRGGSVLTATPTGLRYGGRFTLALDAAAAHASLAGAGAGALGPVALSLAKIGGAGIHIVRAPALRLGPGGRAAFSLRSRPTG